MKFHGGKPLRRTKTPLIRWRGKPFDILAACALAVEEHKRGNLQAAADIYSLVLRKAPDYAEGYNNRGVVLQSMQRFPEALASYEKAIALKPAYANAHFNRGTALRKLLRRDEALASYDRAIEFNPEHAEAYNNRGVLFQELNRHDDALASYERAIALKPDHAEAHNNRGIVLASKGRMDEAEKMFLQAAKLKPNFPDPLFNLANVRSYQNAENLEVSSIQAMLEKPGLSQENAEHLYFSLGKIFDDCGRNDEAFEYFRKANQIRNAQVAYDSRSVEKMTDNIIRLFTKDFLAASFPFASDSQTPLFIVGMPRSGTTLLASMLSNHPSIAPAGELSTIPDFASALQTLTDASEPYPAAVRNITPEVAKNIISVYEKRLRRDFDQRIPHVIDKNPLNFQHLGLIAMLFPMARILHCTRNPLATCLSNYFQRFPLNLDYAFDLRNIGHFYCQYSRLMEHWHTIPRLKLMNVSYEDIILNTEKTARAMLGFLELEWDNQCLTPHTNKYPVETASQWQVRQPIYQHSLENWRRYKKHLAPLVEQLSSITSAAR